MDEYERELSKLRLRGEVAREAKIRAGYTSVSDAMGGVDNILRSMKGSLVSEVASASVFDGPCDDPGFKTRRATWRGMECRGVPGIHIDAMREGVKNTIAMRVVKKWVRSSELSLTLYGPPGTYKSFAGAWLCSLNIDKKARFVDAVEMCMDVLSAGFKKLERLKFYIGLDLLVLDDLGAELNNSDFRDVVDAVLRLRHDNGKRVVATTNKTLGELRGGYDGRTVDRYWPAYKRSRGRRNGFIDVPALEKTHGKNKKQA